MFLYFLSLLFLLTLVTINASLMCDNVTLSNVQPRVDNRGEIMDAHDSHIMQRPGDNKFYWFAASYGDCQEPKGSTGCTSMKEGACGFRLNHNVSMWSSLDLQHWEYGGVVFEATSLPIPSIMFCPKVIYNQLTSSFVLWLNVVRENFSISYIAQASSPSPFGPFKLENKEVKLANPSVGDFGLFVDENEEAYVIYTSHIVQQPLHHLISVERLSDDFRSSSLVNSGVFGPPFVEAPVLFRHHQTGVYWALFGHECCYCEQGAPVFAYSSISPLGPYLAQEGGFWPIDDQSIKAQQTDVFAYRSSPRSGLAAAGGGGGVGGGGAGGGGEEWSYMWVGDMWQQSPTGLKSGDPTYWSPLRFNISSNRKTSTNRRETIVPFRFQPTFNITVCH